MLAAVVALVAAMTVVSVTDADARTEAVKEGQTVTRVFVDGEKKRTIVGNGSAQFRVSAGCHNIKAVKTRQGQNSRSVSSQRLCPSSPSTVTVRVSNGNVSISSSSSSVNATQNSTSS